MEYNRVSAVHCGQWSKEASMEHSEYSAVLWSTVESLEYSKVSGVR